MWISSLPYNVEFFWKAPLEAPVQTSEENTPVHDRLYALTLTFLSYLQRHLLRGGQLGSWGVPFWKLEPKRANLRMSHSNLVHCLGMGCFEQNFNALHTALSEDWIVRCPHTGSVGNAMTGNAVLVVHHSPTRVSTHPPKPSYFFAHFTLEDCLMSAFRGLPNVRLQILLLPCTATTEDGIGLTYSQRRIISLGWV